MFARRAVPALGKGLSLSTRRSTQQLVRAPFFAEPSLLCVRHCASKAAPHSPRNKDTSLEENDFIDIDMLASVGSSPSCISGATEATTPAPKEPNVAPALRDVLGVERRPLSPEDAKYSRLGIPLSSDAADAPPPPVRENSRAVTVAAAAAEEETSEGTLPPLPNTEEALPYDDEAFAEMLLAMEVDGALDEAWQDSKRAHLEDVKELTSVLKEMRVRDICCIDVSSKTSNFDYIMFGTCEGARHIHLAAWAAQEADSEKRITKVPRKKTDELWEVVPVGRIVLNLMVESLRNDLSLERKWAVTSSMDPLSAANAPISEGRQVRAHGLWTLTLNLQDLEDFEVDYCKELLMKQF